MYGTRPVTPHGIEGKVIREDKAALGGKATLREVEVNCGLQAPVHLLVVIPNKREKAAPCFLGMNFRGNYQLLPDPQIKLPQVWARTKPAEELRGGDLAVWNIELIIDRGYAFASFYSADIVPDDKDLAETALRQFRDSGSAERGPADTATIMAWSWGFSRMLDYLLDVPEIDGKRIAVVGHSRNGKTALLAAAMDERIAMAIPSQAGCGGTAPSRVNADLAKLDDKGRPTAETLPVINKAFPHWFCGNFKAFNEAIDKLPFDQHELIALCAPRPVLLSNAEEDLWANPSGQFVLLHAAAPVYALFGEKPALPAERPAIDALLNERLGYFIRPGKHSMTTLDWKNWLDYADKWLK
jgi:pimeloyl-ACP methyl ester carboxylesterase